MSKHEQVTPSNDLPAWLFLHDDNSTTFIEPHWHSSVELSYTISGSIANFQIGDSSYETFSGKILVVNTMEVHSIRTYQNPFTDSKALSIIFPYHLLKRYCPNISNFKFVINDLDDKSNTEYNYLKDRLDCLAQIYYNDDSLRKTILILEVLEILLKSFLVRRHLSMKDINDDRQKERLNVIKNYLEENYKADLTLDDVAEHCFLSKEHLSRFFKDKMDITVFQYLNYIRAKHAKPLLLENKITATQVVQECGFSGLRTMDRTLKRVYGLSSREIKEKGQL